MTGQSLIAQGCITPEQLAGALRLQRETHPEMRIGEILVASGHVTPEEVLRALANTLGCPFVTLDTAMVESEAVGVLPWEFLERHNLLPLSCAEDRLTVAVEQFIDVFLIDEIARRSGMIVDVLAANAENIRDVRAKVREAAAHSLEPSAAVSDHSLSKILDQIDGDELEIIDERTDEDPCLEANATESPIVKLVNYIILTALELGASDIHIEPSENTFRVRYRVDGSLVSGENPPRRLLPAVVSRIKILSGLDISERRVPQDGAVTINLRDRAVDLRISSMATKYGEKIVMRVIDRRDEIRGMDDLGLDAAMLQAFRALIREPNGIVLVTGPTGSGKSTTLYGALAEIMADDRNISTIEDPVERRLQGLNQFQVNPKAGFGFPAALRSLLRQDPDVIMVGEIRDAETARLATEAALTGHLVLSTLHTNDAPSAIPRLINMGAEPYMIAATVRGVLAQRLVKRLCPACARTADLTPEQRGLVVSLGASAYGIETCSSARGCSQCRSTGVQRRIGVFDLMITDETLLTTIVHDPAMRNLARIAARAGSVGLLRDGVAKVKRGVIGIETLLSLARPSTNAWCQYDQDDSETAHAA